MPERRNTQNTPSPKRETRKSAALMQSTSIIPQRIKLDGEAYPLEVRRSRRSRYIRLSVDAALRSVRLSLPLRCSTRLALGFLEERRPWINEQLQNLPPTTELKHEACLPVLGQLHRISFEDTVRGQVRREGRTIYLPGMQEAKSRRLTDFLKDELMDVIEPLSHDLAKQLRRKVGKIKLRDMRTRWGSCAPEGDLTFNWRLVFAPLEVVEYVVAHEVAHLRHADHSDKFWAVVEKLDPDFDDQREWLRECGARLFAYRF